ncbi:ATP-binding protein [Dokdonella immobilis]|uniref:histidine kinase n=1 Tax=Dokdonella immobilis TaxID=578942 RepID=A0A1I4ZB65_9GAMM|nr:ATP-binding protein [Dokdonella immobilis]SFN47438.1 PAS domain S-box-containing protein [Dokdonella immobilis]
MSAEALFHGLFDAVPDALIVVDGEGRITLANRQTGRMFGYPPERLSGALIEDLLPTGIRERHRAHRAGYMSAPRVRPMGASGQVLVGLRRDGTEFPVEIALSPLGSGTEMRYLASIRDVSETQRARQALVRNGYDAIVASIGQLALEADDVADVFGYVPRVLADALQLETVVIALIRPGGPAEIRAAIGLDPALGPIDGDALAAALAAGVPVVVDDLGADDHPLACSLLHAREGSGALMPLLDRDRSIGAIIACSRQLRRFDHDALHLLRSVANLLAVFVQRRQTEDQLAHAQRIDALGQLTGGIAHDFNNLLTVISGSLQMLEMEPNGQGAREFISTALRSTSRGAELTSKLLVFARRKQLLPQATDLPALLDDVGVMLRRTLGESIHLEIEVEDDLPAAFVDSSQLETALVNLVLNARDAMPGGGTVTVRAKTILVDASHGHHELQVGHYLLISVIDTGHGMSPEVLSRAMEPFFTTKASGRGSGLGLSMVYGFAKQSGGNLRIESSVGQGTRVALFLPATRSAVQRALPDLQPRLGGGETILVVEDDAAVRSICVAFLGASNYRVLTAASAEDAQQVLLEAPEIALVFTDVMLGPGQNGKQLAAQIRRMKPGMPILLTSGYEQDDTTEAAEFELLRKPYRREQLLSAIRRLLGEP